MEKACSSKWEDLSGRFERCIRGCAILLAKASFKEHPLLVLGLTAPCFRLPVFGSCCFLHGVLEMDSLTMLGVPPAFSTFLILQERSTRSG